MRPRDQLLLLVALIATGLGFWYMDNFKGCLSKSQELSLALGDRKPVACSAAEVQYVSQSSGTELSVRCGISNQRIALFGPTQLAEACGLRFQLIEAWEGGPVQTWNATLNLTWD